MKFISIPVDDAEKMVGQHQFLLKEALKAASYHQDQIDQLSKAVKDVTYMLTEEMVATPGSDSGSTGEPASAAPATSSFVDDGAVEEVRKNDLISVLKEHAIEFGDFDIDVDTIASFLLSK
jgi:hypothetical protein